MPEWLAPFHRPKLTTAQFRKKKAEYVAKYGYRYSIPGFDDVIHIPIKKPITHDEEVLWKNKDFETLGPERTEEIKAEKEKRRQRYLDILGSPNPDWVTNRGSLIGAIDDTQDALSVAAAIGLVAVRYLPKAFSNIIAGPLGWTMTAAQALNMMNEAIAPEMMALSKKRWQDSYTDLNPKAKKAYIKKVKVNRKLGSFKGPIIEALQVTDSIFGFGISLGMVMSLPVTILAGAARRALGHPVKVKWPIPTAKEWDRKYLASPTALAAMWGLKHDTDDVEITQLLFLQNSLAQGYKAKNQEWDPYENIPALDYIQVEAPRPTSLLTIEMIEEVDPEGLNAIGWPSTGERWSRIRDLTDATQPIIVDNLTRYMERNRHNLMGLVGSMNATESGLLALETFSEDDAVQYDYTAWSKTTHALMGAGYLIPDSAPKAGIAKMGNWLEQHELAGSVPTTPEALGFAKDECGFEFVRP